MAGFTSRKARREERAFERRQEARRKKSTPADRVWSLTPLSRRYSLAGVRAIEWAGHIVPIANLTKAQITDILKAPDAVAG